MGWTVQVPTGRREYGLGTGQKTGYLILAVVFLGVGASIFIQRSGRIDALTAVAIGVLGLGLYLALVALRSQLVVDGNRVEVRGAVRTREFDLSQVEGYRTFKSRYGSYRVICLREGGGTISLQNFGRGQALQQWLAELKDLDAEDRAQLLEKIDQDQGLGATPEQRRGALTSAKRLSVGLFAVDVLAAATLLLGPEPYRIMAMTVVAMGPVAAAYLVYKQPLLYAILRGKSDPRADVSLVLIISGFGLLMMGMRVNFISMGQLMPFIAVGTLASIAMFFAAARKNPRLAGTLLGLCILSAFYGWGLAATADIVADRSVAQTYSARVVGGHVSHGRSTSYYLELGPWGPNAVATQMTVNRGTYYATQRGDVICLGLHAGALHAPWYERVACGE